MKIAVVGSRGICLDDSTLKKYLLGVTEIVSGGAVGVDRCAASYAKRNNIKLTEFLPNDRLYGRAAPIIRNREIVNYADRVVVFWNGTSRGSLFVIQYARQVNRDCEVVLIK